MIINLIFYIQVWLKTDVRRVEAWGGWRLYLGKVTQIMTSGWTPVFVAHKIPRIQDQVIDHSNEPAMDDLIKTKTVKSRTRGSNFIISA